MQKKLMVTVFALIFSYSFSQEKEKSKFSIKLGTEYRITPIYSSRVEYTSKPSVNFNLDKQLSGTSINYSLSYITIKKFEIGFSQSFRYDHIYYKSSFSDIIPNTNYPFAEGESVNDWVVDYHLFIGKYFRIFKSEFFIKGGVSMMNRGANYSITYLVSKDNQGGYTYATDQLNFNFFALNFNTGFTYGKSEFGLGTYFISGASANFEDERNIIAPYFKFSYRLK